MDTVFIKIHKEALIPPISKIVNWSIHDRVFSSSWKTVITPVFKSGVHTVISNYRPINILLAVLNIAEKWIAEQITTHVNAGSSIHHSMEMANCFLLKILRLNWTGEEW